MTENVWEEIWNKPAFQYLSYSPDELVPMPGIISVNKEWLHEVKAEGDRLQREGLEHHAIAISYYEKLKAVKKYCLGVLEETKDFPNWMVIVRKLMRDILKILEAEG